MKPQKGQGLELNYKNKASASHGYFYFKNLIWKLEIRRE
jgi:hypothetical protein